MQSARDSSIDADDFLKRSVATRLNADSGISNDTDPAFLNSARVRFGKYRPDQARDAEGQWVDEGGATAGSSGARTAALVGAGLAGLAGVAALDRRVLGPLLRAANRRADLRLKWQELRAQASARRYLRDIARRADAPKGVQRAVTESARRTDEALNRAGRAVRADRAAAAVERGIDKLPPKVREQVKQTIRGGHEVVNPSGKLLDLPSWLWPF